MEYSWQKQTPFDGYHDEDKGPFKEVYPSLSAMQLLPSLQLLAVEACHSHLSLH